MCSVVEHTQASLTGSGVLIVSSVCRPVCMQESGNMHSANEIASIFISSCKTIYTVCGLHHPAWWGQGEALRSVYTSPPMPAGTTEYRIEPSHEGFNPL